MNTISPIVISNQYYGIRNKSKKGTISFGNRKSYIKPVCYMIPAATAVVCHSIIDGTVCEANKLRQQHLYEKLRSIPMSNTYLMEQCQKEMIDCNTIKSYNYNKYSDFTQESLELVEQFAENESLYTNEYLCNGIMDKIVSKLSAKNNKTNYKHINDIASKIKLVSDTYLSNPDCQKSNAVQKNIAFMMYRAIDADDAVLNQVLEMMKKPDDYNNEEYVDTLVYKMKAAEPSKTANQTLNNRIDNARKKLDAIINYRFLEMGLNNLALPNQYEVNSLTLSFVEKFLNEDRLRNNKDWENVIFTALSSINTMIYGGTGSISDVRAKTKQINESIDKFLADNSDLPDDVKAPKYISGINYY